MRTTFGSLALQPHQINVCKLIVKDVPGLLLFFKVGSGKTLSSIAAAENLAAYDAYVNRKVVVILPASLRDNFNKELRASDVRYPRRYKVYSFHKIHRMTLEERQRLGRNAFVIIDEVQNLRNPLNESLDQQRNAKPTMLDSALDVCRGAHKRLLLSGTPMMNFVYELGSCIALIDPTRYERVALKEWKIDARTGRRVSAPVWVRTFGKHGELNRPLLSQILNCKVLFYEPPPDVVRQHYPTSQEHVVRVPMSPVQTREHYKIMDEIGENGIINLQNVENDIPNTMKFLVGLRLVCNSVGNHHPKMDVAVNSIANSVSVGGRCVVFSSYLKHGLHRMKDLLRARNVPCVVFEGATPDRERAEIVRRYNSGEVPVILLSDAGKEGLDLKNTAQVHIMEPQWNEEKVKQAIGRAVRYKSHTGTMRHVDIYRYVMYIHPNSPSPTGDEILFKVSKQKQQNIDRFTQWLIDLSDRNLRTCI